MPKENLKKETFFKQKIISIPIVACGKTLPKYSKNEGVSLPLKIKKGINLNSAVTPAITAIIRIEFKTLVDIFFYPLFFVVGKSKHGENNHNDYHRWN